MLMFNVQVNMLKLRFGLILLLSFYLSTSLAQLEIDLACPQVHRTQYTVHCTLAMYIEQFNLDLVCPQVHSTPYTVQFTLYTDHEQLYIEVA